MQRREFLTLIGGAAMVWPLAGRAQQNSGPRKVGVLFPGIFGADRERLINEGLTKELGGKKAILVVRSSDGDDRLLGKYAGELAAGVDVILAIASVSLVAARQASQTSRSSRLISNPTLLRPGWWKASTDPAAT